MKKIYLLGLILIMSASLISQNLVSNGGLESWDDPATPSGWDIMESISQEATTVHTGTYAAAHTSNESTTDFRQDLNGIVGGQEYVISYYFMDNDAMARTRIWSYWMEDGNYLTENEEELRPGVYSEDNPEWMHYSFNLTAPMNANQFRFEVRVYKQDGSWGGKVYYDDFSFEQNQTTFPEPSNYPTSFTAVAQGQGITLNWADAGGAQLPGAYLILGELGSLTASAPVDGTPVADDFDWADGKAAANVLYGQQTFAFNGLQAGESYEFTIYPYTNSGVNIDYKTDGSVPEATATVQNVVILNEEGFDVDLGSWTPYSVVGVLEWYQDSFNDQTFAKMSGYDGGAQANEDWLISPLLNFTDIDMGYFSFISAMNYTGPALQLYVSTDYEGSGDPNDAEWTEITSDAQWSGGNWSWDESGEIDLTSHLSPETYLAFKFTSTDTESATWELDDLLVYGVASLGVNEVAEAELLLFPNPAANTLHINVESRGEVTICNSIGQRLHAQPLTTGQNTIDISKLEVGLYLIQFVDEKNASSTQKLIVE